MTLSYRSGLGKSKSGERMEKTIHTREYAVVLQLLREARKRAGVTQIDLAKKIDESQSIVSKMERGELRLDIVQLRTICRVLGMTLTDFADRLERELAKRK